MMQAIDVEQASNDEHLVLGTVTSAIYGHVLIRVDHCVSVPRRGQQVKVLAIDSNEGRSQ